MDYFTSPINVSMTFAGCGNNNAAHNNTNTPVIEETVEISDDVIEAVVEEEISETDEEISESTEIDTEDSASNDEEPIKSENTSDYYGIDANLLENYCVQVPMLSFSITEIGVFKVKDANNTSQIVNTINDRANSIGIMLYPSLEETYNSRQVITKGEYILFVISDDVNQIVSKFNTFV